MRTSTIAVSVAALLILTALFGGTIAGAYGGYGAKGRAAANTAYDEMFTDINEGVFTTKKAEVVGENGNYFRRARIDVVDEKGYDHQGMIFVCQGDDSFTKGYRDYLNGLEELYAEKAGEVAGYRNAAVRGYRTYRDHDVDFFCLKEVAFTDFEGIRRQGVLVAVDGSDEFADQEWELYSQLMDFYYNDK